jgi:hypothetical protein
MYIKPEDRTVGKENFEAAIAVGKRDGMSRRDFLVGTVAAGAVSGAGLGAMYFGYGKSVENPVRIGFIGTGDEGSVLIGAHTPSYVQCVAIADIRPYNIHRAFHGDYSSDTAFQARPGLMAKYGWSSEEEARKHVKVFTDYKDMLKAVQNKELDLEGVVIALPLHLHAEAAILAMKAGLHVLTEKLMARTVARRWAAWRSRPASIWRPAINGITAFCTTMRSTPSRTACWESCITFALSGTAGRIPGSRLFLEMRSW